MKATLVVVSGSFLTSRFAEFLFFSLFPFLFENMKQGGGQGFALIIPFSVAKKGSKWI